MEKLKKFENYFNIDESDTEEPEYDPRMGLIYYFEIPFVKEDLEEIIKFVKSSNIMQNTTKLKNGENQFEVYPTLYIRDKVNEGKHEFTINQLEKLIKYYKTFNKEKLASREDFNH